jgi:hypothetical protein
MGSGAMTKLSKILAIVALLLPGIASAQFYNIFGPVTGIMVGNVNSPQTTVATSANVTGLFVGTNCSGAALLQLTGGCIPAISLADSTGDLSYGIGPGALANATLTTAVKGFTIAIGEDAVGGQGAGYSPGAVNAEVTAVGWRAGASLTTGTFDTYIGAGTGRGETTGSNDTCLGVDCMGGAITDSGSSGFGVAAIKNGTQTNSTAVGAGALTGQASTTGGNNVAIGENAMTGANLTTGANNVVVGTANFGGVTTGNNNTAVGFNSFMTETTGGQNTCVGYQSCKNQNTESYNTGIGANAGGAWTTGNHNVQVGGFSSGPIGTTGSTNTTVGYNTDIASVGMSNEINIGNFYFGTSVSAAQPVVSACGTTPTIDAKANNKSGTVTVGTGAAASCTITFAGGGFSTWNHCRVTSQVSAAAFAYSYTVTAITVTATSLLTDKIDYDCDGA